MNENEYGIASADTGAIASITAQIAAWTAKPGSAARTRALALLATDLTAAQSALTPAQSIARAVIAASGGGGGSVGVVVAGAGIAVDATDPTHPVVSNAGVRSVVAGTNITVDVTDPRNPIIASTGGGASLPTKISIPFTTMQAPPRNRQKNVKIFTIPAGSWLRRCWSVYRSQVTVIDNGPDALPTSVILNVGTSPLGSNTNSGLDQLDVLNNLSRIGKIWQSNDTSVMNGMTNAAGGADTDLWLQVSANGGLNDINAGQVDYYFDIARVE